MIQTKKDLKEYMEKDRARYVAGNAKWYQKLLYRNEYLRYLECLRKAEYCCNNGRLQKYYYIKKLQRLKNKSQIDLGINVAGPGLHLPHGKVVISSLAKIGENCQIYSDVTVGVDGKGGGAPTIGDGVIIGSGARIIGDVTVADGVTIGANAVVLSDITEPGATAVGIPAKIVKKSESRSDL